MKKKILFTLFFVLFGSLVTGTSFANNALPDLTVESVAINPDNPSANEEFDVTVQVRNIGQGSSSGIRLHLYVNPTDQPPTTTTPHTSTTFYGFGLGSGQSFRYSRTGVTLPEGNYPVYVWLDRDDQVEEEEETNNLRCITVTVGEVDPQNKCETPTSIGLKTQSVAGTTSLTILPLLVLSVLSGCQIHRSRR